jgi:hypothetical protein
MGFFIDANLAPLQARAGGLSDDRVLEAERLIEEEQRSGRSLDEAAEAVKASRPDMKETTISEARQEVFARFFDESEDVRKAVYEAVQYLDFNPRKVKRFINVFRLQALIANRLGLLGSKLIDLDLLARAVVIAMRWPDVVNEMVNLRRFDRLYTNLVHAHRTRNQLRRAEAQVWTAEPDREELSSRLATLLTDRRVERLIDADELIQLLEDIGVPERLFSCIRLVTEGLR